MFLISGIYSVYIPRWPFQNPKLQASLLEYVIHNTSHPLLWMNLTNDLLQMNAKRLLQPYNQRLLGDGENIDYILYIKS